MSGAGVSGVWGFNIIKGLNTPVLACLKQDRRSGPGYNDEHTWYI